MLSDFQRKIIKLFALCYVGTRLAMTLTGRILVLSIKLSIKHRFFVSSKFKS